MPRGIGVFHGARSEIPTITTKFLVLAAFQDASLHVRNSRAAIASTAPNSHFPGGWLHSAGEKPLGGDERNGMLGFRSGLSFTIGCVYAFGHA